MNKNVLALTLSLLTVSNIVYASDIKIMPYQHETIGYEETGNREHYVICDGCAPYQKLVLGHREEPAKVASALSYESKESDMVVDFNMDEELKQSALREVSLLNNSGKTCKLGTIKFGLNKYKIIESERLKLNRIVEKINEIDEPVVSVSGYTCSLGSLSLNNDLSKKRATHVANQLTKKGVNVSLIEGKGKCCYVSDDKRVNRRVEINLIKKEGENCND